MVHCCFPRRRDAPDRICAAGFAKGEHVIPNPRAPEIDFADQHRALTMIDNSVAVVAVVDGDRSGALARDGEAVVNCAVGGSSRRDESHHAALRG